MIIWRLRLCAKKIMLTLAFGKECGAGALSILLILSGIMNWICFVALPCVLVRILLKETPCEYAQFEYTVGDMQRLSQWGSQLKRVPTPVDDVWMFCCIIIMFSTNFGSNSFVISHRHGVIVIQRFIQILFEFNGLCWDVSIDNWRGDNETFRLHLGNVQIRQWLSIFELPII